MLRLVILGNKTINLDFSNKLTLKNIKQYLCDKFNIDDVSSLKFIYKTEPLTDDKEITDYEDNELVMIIEDESIKQKFLEGGKLNIVIHINSVIKFEYKENFYTPLTLKIIRDFLSTKYELNTSEVNELKCIINGTIFTEETIYKNYNDRKLIVFTTEENIRDKIKIKEGVKPSIFTVSDLNSTSYDDLEDADNVVDNECLPEYKAVELENDTDIDEVLALFKNEDFKKLLQIYNKSPELLEMLYLFTNSGDIVVESTDIDESTFDYVKEFDFIFNKFDDQAIPINSNIIKSLLQKHKGNVNLVIRNFIQLKSFE
jgi:hypothetical protein